LKRNGGTEVEKQYGRSHQEKKKKKRRATPYKSEDESAQAGGTSESSDFDRGPGGEKRD